MGPILSVSWKKTVLWAAGGQNWKFSEKITCASLCHSDGHLCIIYMGSILSVSKARAASKETYRQNCLLLSRPGQSAWARRKNSYVLSQSGSSQANLGPTITEKIGHPISYKNLLRQVEIWSDSSLIWSQSQNLLFFCGK